nr:MAG TPA: hypothetical protein [Caudoviricetes sp.]
MTHHMQCVIVMLLHKMRITFKGGVHSGQCG